LKSEWKKVLILISSLLLILLGLIGLCVYVFFSNNMIFLPKGDLISEVSSPKGTYTLKAYVNNGGATVDYAVRGELNFNKENRKPKNIYWNYHESSASIEWIDERTVVINGHKLKVPDETFDWRQ
jgi:hypothetical protein